LLCWENLNNLLRVNKQFLEMRLTFQYLWFTLSLIKLRLGTQGKAKSRMGGNELVALVALRREVKYVPYV